MSIDMSTRLDEFEAYRTRMNERILSIDHLGIKRFFSLDTQAYTDGALDARTKELRGLTASLVLRSVLRMPLAERLVLILVVV